MNSGQPGSTGRKAPPGEPTAEAYSRGGSFDRVAAGLADPLLRFLQAYIGDPVAAQDLRQETLIRVARGLPIFRGESSVKTWAYAIAVRVAADYLAAPERRAVLVAMDDAVPQAESGPPLDQRLLADEMNTCIRKVIDSLPEDYRAALILHDLEGLTVAETAAVCSCSLPTAKIRVHRARARLRLALEDQCEFYRDGDNVRRCDRKQQPVRITSLRKP